MAVAMDVEGLDVDMDMGINRLESRWKTSGRLY